MKIFTLCIILILFFISCLEKDKKQSALETYNAADVIEQNEQFENKTNSSNKGIIEKDEKIPKGINQATVRLSELDSSINLDANINLDHKIFGYSEPNINSEKLLLLSVFTSDVQNNPYNCKIGAYYDTKGMNGYIIKFKEMKEEFVEAIVTDDEGESTIIYFEKNWIKFE